MTIAKGFDCIGAAKKGSAWGTAVACGTDDAIEILSHSINPVIEQNEDNSLGSGPWQKIDGRGHERNEGEFSTYLKYEGLDFLLALFMGTAGTPTQIETTAYYNDYKLKDDLAGLFATLCFDNTINIEEWDSVKLNSMTIRGDSGQRLEISFGVLARVFTNDSAVNTASTTWTVPSNREFIMFNDGMFRINAQGAAALDTADIVYPSAFEITVAHNMSPIYRAASAAGGSSYQTVEPSRDGFGTITGSLTFPTYEAESMQDWFLANTVLKADIDFQGSLIAGTSYNQLLMYLTQLKVVDNPKNPPGGPARIQQTLNFRATLPDAAPAGMTGVTKPFEIHVQNAITVDPLA